jgi:hypothetical protein
MAEIVDFEQLTHAFMQRMGFDTHLSAGQLLYLRAGVIDELRLVWNARGAADIARLEAEIPNVWTTAEAAGALTRALRALDR